MKFQKIIFKGFKDIDWEKVFNRTKLLHRCSSYSWFSSIRWILASLAPQKIMYVESFVENHKILCYTSDTTRASYEQQFDSFSELLNASKVKAYQTGKHSINLHLRLWISWINELRKYNAPFDLKCHMLKDLSELFQFQNYLKTLPITEYKALVVFCDAMLDQAFLVSYCKQLGLKTITLQHGQFTAKRDDVFINSGAELSSTSSDYFLAWNNMTIEEAKKENVCHEGFIKSGILGYLNTEYKEADIVEAPLFGVVLDHPSFESNNIELIKAANILSQKTGLDYVLKLHPNYDTHHFDAIVNGHFKNIVTKGIPIVEYANQVRFSLVGSSTVFVELVYINHRTIRYSNGSTIDKFRDVPFGATFKRCEDILDAYSNVDLSDEEKSNLFDYLCSFKNVKKRYIEVINSITDNV